MWFKNKKFNVAFISLAVVCVIAASLISYAINVAHAKQSLHSRISFEITKLLVQQQMLLQRLSKQLIIPIQQQEYANISAHLRTYEDQLFTLSKQGLTVPVNVQWVSFNAPQRIINSSGNAEALAPDDNYYLQVVADPMQLRLSEQYTTTEMPNHLLLNWGLGVVEDNNYLGHLDVKSSLDAINAYVHDKVYLDSDLFSFNIVAADSLRPEIVLNNETYFLGIAKYTSSWLFAALLLYLLITLSCKLYTRLKSQTYKIQQYEAQIETLITNAAMHRLGADTQNRYGILAVEPDIHKNQIMDLHHLLQDVKAVNADLAMTRNINLNFPIQNDKHIRIHANKLRLMQILSGMLYEIINQLPMGSNISLHMVVASMSNNLQRFTFKFIDDGFYTALQDRAEIVSKADIRVKGWNNIADLIALEEGTLEHTHTAYSGNTICFTITRKVVSNVISLALQ